MEKKEWVMPTHIIATAGIVINEKDEVLMVKTHNYDWVFSGGQVEVWLQKSFLKMSGKY